jgi:2,4-dienoyl-CoA reductase-like NADH-dependent reductase (Old Yellow Enzyme family)
MNSTEPMSAPAVAALFKPFSVGSLTVPNRFVMSPMTRNFSPGGVPGADVADYYARRAEHGVGLIITEGTVVGHPASASSDTVPRFSGEDALAGWARVVERVHAAGGRIVPQLWHVGMDRTAENPPRPGVAPVGPSGISLTGETVGEPMTEADIADVIAAFARAAAEAERLGFDGIELHGGHGYLIDQFFWDRTNQRQDQYGGDLVARTRFAAELVAACRAAVSPGFPVILRISQWKITDFEARPYPSPQDLERFLGPLVSAGVDVIHCSARRFWQPEFDGSPLNLAGWARKVSGLPSITVGSVGLDNEFLAAIVEGRGAGNADLGELVRRVEEEEFDLIAVGRLLLADPEWVAKVRDGRFDDLQPFRAESMAKLT